MTQQELKELLDAKVAMYNAPDFIETDPISIPYQFSQLEDIEIIGFWTAMLAWGQRKTIINSSNRLIELMDGAPYDFILNHEEIDLKRFLDFKHRTFQPTDALYFIQFFREYYKNNDSLENEFVRHLHSDAKTVEEALIGFHNAFFNLKDAPQRTKKHVATPARKSTCKRINMFLRWMVRDSGVDFGLWKRIKTSQLLIPLDVHVDRVGRRLGLLERKQTDWKSVLELTENLREFDANDPVKYDFALFGMGVLDWD